MKASPTGGVKPMPIAGRTVRDRERAIGMTNEERLWRKQWVLDQQLSHNEPRHVPELHKSLCNPIRRVYRYPLDALATALEPTFGKRVHYVRYFTGKFLMLVSGSMAIAYYFKYNRHDWSRVGGWNVIESKVAVVPGDPGYPKVSEKTKGADYDSRGFEKVKMNL